MTPLERAEVGGGPTVLRGGRLVLADRIVEEGWIRIDESGITAMGTGDVPVPAQRGGEQDRPTIVALGGRTVVAGFVDLHVHGGGGRCFADKESDSAEIVAELHREHGTTTQLASVGTDTAATMLAATERLARLVRVGVISGIHLEGPFLNPLRRGAHDAAKLRLPDRGLLDELLGAADGAVRVVTVAPELPGGIELIEAVAVGGAIPAIGHTDASFAEATRAVQAGARLATHLFNGMRPLHHREPGVAAAALLAEGVVVELINDGHHLADATARLAQRTAGAGRTALVTDAMAAAGVGDGIYRVAEREVRVHGGKAMLADGSSLAGSCLTMDVALRRAVQNLDFSIVDAAQAASSVPARLLGLDDRGSLAPGQRADLVVLDDAVEVVGVMRQGSWVSGGPGVWDDMSPVSTPVAEGHSQP